MGDAAYDKKISLWMRAQDHAKAEAIARDMARKPAEVLRAAIVLGLEVLERQGDKAMRRALAGEPPAP